MQLPWKHSKKLIFTTSHEKKYENIKKGILINFKTIKIFFFLLLAFVLAVAYSATIGGLSSLVGTAPNIFVKGFSDRLKNHQTFYFLSMYLFYL